MMDIAAPTFHECCQILRHPKAKARLGGLGEHTHCKVEPARSSQRREHVLRPDDPRKQVKVGCVQRSFQRCRRGTAQFSWGDVCCERQRLQRHVWWGLFGSQDGQRWLDSSGRVPPYRGVPKMGMQCLGRSGRLRAVQCGVCAHDARKLRHCIRHIHQPKSGHESRRGVAIGLHCRMERPTVVERAPIAKIAVDPPTVTVHIQPEVLVWTVSWHERAHIRPQSR
mmetsp:Transcript_23951/g.62609  ORF Transcript_23951/g.62609 Transcript_23951/m.62609 type:complete len:224 (+) Transcript_23951:547-1218(+)